VARFETYIQIFTRAQQYYWGYFVDLVANPGWNPVYVIVGSVLILSALEQIAPWKPARVVTGRGFRLDVFYTLFNYVLFWWTAGYALCYLSAEIFEDALREVFGLRNLVATRVGSFPGGVQLVLLFLLSDLVGYAGHRALHRFDSLWQFHKVHHAATQLDVWNAGRGHVVENLIYPALRFIPMSVIGFQVEYTIGATFLQYLLTNFSHANLDLPIGPLRYVINHPQMHRWHHDRAIAAREGVNYGNALVIWDYLFGTAHLPRDAEVGELGFDGIEAYPKGFFRELLQPFVDLIRSRRRGSGSAPPFAAPH